MQNSSGISCHFQTPLAPIAGDGRILNQAHQIKLGASYPDPSPGWSFQEHFRLTASAPFVQANFGHCQEGFIAVNDAP
jgi:hypothetical protein